MYKLYIKMHRKSILIWSIIIPFFVIATMQKYSGFSATPGAATQIVDQLPRIVRVIFGIGDIDISTMDGYFAVSFLYFQVMIAAYAAMLGANIIYEEEKYKTSEFIFTKPISRSKVLIKKALAALTILLFLSLLLEGISYYYIKVILDEAVTNFYQLALSQFIIAVFTFAIGLFLSSMTFNRIAMTLSITILLTMFLLRTVALMIDSKIGYLSPYYTFDSAEIVLNGISIPLVIIYTLISISLIVLATKFLKDRDIKS